MKSRRASERPARAKAEIISPFQPVMILRSVTGGGRFARASYSLGRTRRRNARSSSAGIRDRLRTLLPWEWPVPVPLKRVAALTQSLWPGEAAAARGAERPRGLAAPGPAE